MSVQRADASERRTQHSDIRELTPGNDYRDDRRGVAHPQTPRTSGGAALTNYLNRTLVAAYKLVGFSLLAIILLGLFAYIALNALFVLHKAWIAPAILAPSDNRVLELRARLAHEVWDREKVQAEHARILSDAKHARRTQLMEEQYQETFKAAVSKNASFQRSRFRNIRDLRADLESVAASLDEATARFTTMQTESLESAYDANLINRQEKATGDYRLTELEARKVSLQQHKAQLNNQLIELTQQLDSLGTVAQDPSAGVPATLEGLDLKRNFMTSVLAAQRARDEVKALEASAFALSETLKGYDSVISIIKESPLLLAASGEVRVAFVPYDNLPNATEGAPVFGCDAYVISCRPVGRVGKMVEGEAVAKHPLYGNDLRGKFVRLELDEVSWAKRAVLHVGRAPLFF